MQCKDIPEKPILELLNKNKSTWTMILEIKVAFPAEVNMNLMLAKLRKMINKGIIDGCACGCRGDFTITEKGKQVLISFKE